MHVAYVWIQCHFVGWEASTDFGIPLASSTNPLQVPKGKCLYLPNTHPHFLDISTWLALAKGHPKGTDSPVTPPYSYARRVSSSLMVPKEFMCVSLQGSPPIVADLPLGEQSSCSTFPIPSLPKQTSWLSTPRRKHSSSLKLNSQTHLQPRGVDACLGLKWSQPYNMTFLFQGTLEDI